jgi:phosphoribosylaminoimidazole (AIR) synthetase
MKWFHRLIYSLAKKQIEESLKKQLEESFAAGCEMQRVAYVAGEITRMELVKSRAYAEGELAGQKQAWDEIEKIIDNRTNGLPDYVEPEDLRLAKKALIH